MKSIHDQYMEVLKKCTFISKPGEWFVEGTNCEIVDDVVYIEYQQGYKFNAVSVLMRGCTMETFEGYAGPLPRIDEEGCPLDEFFIFDNTGLEISELSLDQYNKLK